MQMLPNGRAFIGWGTAPVFSEYDVDGQLCFNARFPEDVTTYRAYRFPWTGRPADAPSVAAESTGENEVTVYASWNGANEIATWEVFAGPDPARLRPVGSAPRAGFETTIAVQTAEPYLAVQAKDRSGKELGVSTAVQPSG
jgi:hypothetical protein